MIFLLLMIFPLRSRHDFIFFSEIHFIFPAELLCDFISFLLYRILRIWGKISSSCVELEPYKDMMSFTQAQLKIELEFKPIEDKLTKIYLVNSSSFILPSLTKDVLKIHSINFRCNSNFPIEIYFCNSNRQLIILKILIPYKLCLFISFV